MLTALKHKIVFSRALHAENDRKLADKHPEGSEAYAFYTLRAKFWADAAADAAAGDLTPRYFDLQLALDEALGEGVTPPEPWTHAVGLPVVIVVVR